MEQSAPVSGSIAMSLGPNDPFANKAQQMHPGGPQANASMGFAPNIVGANASLRTNVSAPVGGQVQFLC